MAIAPHNRFRTVFQAHFEDIQAYCLRRLPPEDASDATSEVFTVAWRRIESMPEGADARLWLFGVARNVIRNTGRSSRRRSRTTARLLSLAREDVMDPQHHVVAATEYREMMNALRTLSSSDQEVLQLRLWEELTVDETATVLDCSPKAASKRYQRALQRLSAELSEPITSQTGPRLAHGGGEQ